MTAKKAKKILYLKVEKKERSSQFVVDLKTTLTDQDIKEENFSILNKTGDIFVESKNKIKDVCKKIKLIFEFNKLKIYFNWKAPFKKIKNLKALAVGLFSFKKIKNTYLRLSRQLFFLNIFNLIYKLIFKASYAVGWLIIFFIKFFYLFTVRIFNLFLKIRFSNLNNIFKKALYFLLGIKEYFILNKTLIKKVDLNEKKEIFDNFFEKEQLLSDRLVFRKAFYFLLVALAIILPFKAVDVYGDFNANDLKGRVLGVSEKAISSLKEASISAVNMDFGQAGDKFSEASEGFLAAQSELDKINSLFFTLGKFAPNQEIRLASQSKYLLTAGENISKIGENMSLGINSFLNYNSENFIDAIDNFSFYCVNSLNYTNKANQELANVDLNSLPKEMRNTFLELKEKLIFFEKSLQDLENMVSQLKFFLGETQDKRYLLIFQNNSEMRASGGFIGSYALLDFRNGRIKKLEVPEGGTYDTEAGLSELVASPEPLHLVNPLWHFWDANWWPDWPTTAQKLMWFYEKSDGPTVDGVISFTPSIIEDLLEIIGEVDMSEDYGVKVNKDNFLITAQSIIEDNKNSHLINPENDKPKKFIGDLTFKLLEELPGKIDKKSLISILKITEKNIKEKHILFYFNDKKLQSEVEDWDWAGKVKNTRWDYLSVINSNIAGGKTDRKIKEELFHKTELQSDGSLINTLKIIRTHEGIKNEPFSGVRNVNWIRIYVPQGSRLIEADGFRRPDDIYFENPDPSWKKDELIFETEMKAQVDERSGTKTYNEGSKTVFANWSMVDPGKSVTMIIKYKLPFNINNNYSEENTWSNIKSFFNPGQKELSTFALMVQKQPGSKASFFSSEFILTPDYSSIWHYPGDSEVLYPGGWKINSELDRDKYWAVIIENN